MSKLNKALFVILSVAIVVSLGFIIYIAVTPQQVNKFTEFYILNVDGKAGDYPKQAVAGNPVDVLLGVVNHEYQPADYRVEIQMDSTKVGEMDIGTLAYQQKWEQKVGFIPRVVGQRQIVDFILYKDGGTEPYLKEPLTLHIDVVSP
jgi:uncharacterized membrane protein